ncbi:hypothetical protein [Chelatococcus sp. XZ-Ab1]|uniref:hypothetical protein n=1 Tax=Chelatococcus sp. XZ-Ab1 TaxID=3034027 RepID=UPI0023E4679A|nr:hypothetical protein [Chelatococcus sp. XZ-Ab1]
MIGEDDNGYDDFVEILPEGKVAPKQCALTISTTELRGGAERITLSFTQELLAQLEGWPRFRVAWNPKTFQMRIVGAETGPFEAFKTQRGERYILRVPMQKGLKHVKGLKEPAPHLVAPSLHGGPRHCLLVTVPPVFRRPEVAGTAPAARPNGMLDRRPATPVVPAARVGR